MQPSSYDIQREVEALRDIRRRSTTPGALAIDPDLPNQASSTSSTYSWSPPSDSSSNSDHDDSESSTGHTTVETEPSADDPFHLFWVPASVHPEIAPAEFREFLREHSRSPPPADGSAVSVSRSPSFGLDRKKSMLSRQYRPSENDGVEDRVEKIVPLSRNRSTRYANQGPQLTISDLQKLEELAEEASESDDPSKLRNILRRSLSLNISPTAIEKMQNMPEMGDEADAPIIIPPRNQILRRSARTKIRKPGLPGDGGGHRFGASRRGGRSSTSDRSSTEQPSIDHGEPESRPRVLSNEFQAPRPESFSEETSIYDSYVVEEEPSTILVTTSPPPHEPATEVPRQESPLPPSQTPAEPAPPPPSDEMLHHPKPQRLLSPQVIPEPSPPSRTPSPSSSVPDTTTSPPSFLSSPPPPHRKERDKKGLFGKWGSDKGGKKGRDHTRSDSGERAEREREKDSGFFGSLFGGKKSKEAESTASSSVSHAAGREAAQALLGASKSSKAYQPPPSPGAQAINNYSRYPIHVERAIYRLSHIKLANPRRPLYEQVLISNLMFWYLGVINKAQNPQANGQGQAGAGQQAGAPSAEKDKEQHEKEQREVEQREKERQEHERQEREQREREQREREKREVSPKRGPLTKPAPMGTGGGGGRRAAEVPIRGPQYDMQHREMEQAYGGYANAYNGGQQNNMSPGRRSPGPGHRSSLSNQAPRLVQPQAETQPAEHFYYSPDQSQSQQSLYMQQQRLPPGAMAPIDAWSGPGSPRQHTNSPPPANSIPHRRSQSPPPKSYNSQQQQQGMYGASGSMAGGGRTPGRSLSATAIPSLSPSPPSNANVNGKLRKGVSAHAVVSPPKTRPRTPEGQQRGYHSQNGPNGLAEEEDMPLAMWQQQRKR